MRVPMRETAYVTLDGSGNGTAKVGPLSARETWYPQNIAVKANSNAVNESQCNVFVGADTSQDNYRDGTVNGSAGDSTDKCNGDAVKCGQYVWAVWSGGDANAVAYMVITGTKEV